MTARPPKPTPTPMPILAPVESPDLIGGVDVDEVLPEAVIEAVLAGEWVPTAVDVTETLEVEVTPIKFIPTTPFWEISTIFSAAVA